MDLDIFFSWMILESRSSLIKLSRPAPTAAGPVDLSFTFQQVCVCVYRFKPWRGLARLPGTADAPPRMDLWKGEVCENTLFSHTSVKRKKKCRAHLQLLVAHVQRTEWWAHLDDNGSRTEELIIKTNTLSRFPLLTWTVFHLTADDFFNGGRSRQRGGSRNRMESSPFGFGGIPGFGNFPAFDQGRYRVGLIYKTEQP